jgi:hypothetical protein
MFFRDELISWSWRRPPGASPANSAAGGMSSAELKTKVAENVEQVINRVQRIAPQCFPEEVCDSVTVYCNHFTTCWMHLWSSTFNYCVTKWIRAFVFRRRMQQNLPNRCNGACLILLKLLWGPKASAWWIPPGILGSSYHSFGCSAAVWAR